MAATPHDSLFQSEIEDQAASLPGGTTIAPINLNELEQGTSLWADAWYRLKKNRLALISAILVILLALLCFSAEYIAPSYQIQNLDLHDQPPSAQHWFGMDALGRDLFARVLYGGQITFAVGIAATFVALIIGVTYGAIAGYFGGVLDSVMMRLVDIIYALPFTLFVILLSVYFNNDTTRNRFNAFFHTDFGSGFNLVLIFAAIGAIEWLTMARIVRGEVRSLRKQEFVEAAIALGLSRPRIIFRHILPNILGPIIIYTTLTIPDVMLLEAFLSFLGLGVQPPMASWGVLLGDGAKSIEECPWQFIFPVIFFAVTLFSFNFLGDGLRDALDPKTSKD